MRNQIKPDLLSYDDIINELKQQGISMSLRTLNYYKSLGLIPKPVPRGENPKGDRRGHYPRKVLVYFRAYYFLQNHLGFTLKEIKSLVKKFAYHMEGLVPKNPFYSWIIFTYTCFLDDVLTEVKKKIKDYNGVEIILFINYQYKKALKESGISYLAGITEQKGLEGLAKEWVRGLALKG